MFQQKGSYSPQARTAGQRQREEWPNVVRDRVLHGKSTVGEKWEGHGNLAGWRIVGGCEWEVQKAIGAIVVFAGRGEAVGRFWDSESGLAIAPCPKRKVSQVFIDIRVE